MQLSRRSMTRRGTPKVKVLVCTAGLAAEPVVNQQRIRPTHKLLAESNVLC